MQEGSTVVSTVKDTGAATSTITARRCAAEKRSCETINPPIFQIARQRATNWRVDLRLDPRLESSATTPPQSHQAARRNLIDILTPLRG
jgi:hypothetical protein